MKYEVTAHQVLQSDDRLHFFRVQAWYDDDRADQPAALADVVTEFVLRVDDPVRIVSYTTDEWGRRLTESGQWLGGFYERGGEWVPVPPEGPPGDPFVVETEPQDPVAGPRQVIEHTLREMQARGFQGHDLFVKGQDAPAVRAARTPTERAVAAAILTGRVKPRRIDPELPGRRA